MKFKILQENLLQVIQDLQKNIPAKPSLPILSCLFIESKSDTILSFSATDLRLGIRTIAPAEVVELGTIAIPAKTFFEFIHTLSPGMIEIETADLTLSLKAKDAKATFQCFNASDFPPFPEKTGEEITLPMDFFLPAIQNTIFAASMDEARPILTTALLSFGDETEIVCTDGFRLVKQVMNFQYQPMKLLMPAKALGEVLRIAQRKKVDTVAFTVSEQLKQVFFSFADVEILVRLMDGEFPPYQKIFPSEFQTEVEFDGNDFAQKLKTALIFARESSGIIRLQVADQEVRLLSSSASLGTQESSLHAKIIKGGGQEIAFNAKYLVDFFGILKPETIWFGMYESLKPALFRPTQLPGYSYVVMPFRVNQ